MKVYINQDDYGWTSIDLTETQIDWAEITDDELEAIRLWVEKENKNLKRDRNWQYVIPQIISIHKGSVTMQEALKLAEKAKQEMIKLEEKKKKADEKRRKTREENKRKKELAQLEELKKKYDK